MCANKKIFQKIIKNHWKLFPRQTEKIKTKVPKYALVKRLSAGDPGGDKQEPVMRLGAGDLGGDKHALDMRLSAVTLVSKACAHHAA